MRTAWFQQQPSSFLKSSAIIGKKGHKKENCYASKQFESLLLSLLYPESYAEPA